MRKHLSTRKKRLWLTLFLITIFGIGGITGALLCRKYYIHKMLVESPNYNPANMPDSTTVRIDSTNLPIVFINTLEKDVPYKNGRITAIMKIIDNGEGQMNYGDTLKYAHQTIDYEGYIALKYRGNSSFVCTPKKPYSIKTLKQPLEEGGKKKKVKLLGLRKSKKWALKAGCLEKSMIRDALTAELAKPYMDFMPQVRFCEVIVDGVYRGIYYLSEQITADRLHLEKPNESDGALTGGFLLQIDGRGRLFGKQGGFQSKRWENVKYWLEYPDSSKLTVNQKRHICNVIDAVEQSFVNKNDTAAYENLVDVQSMIDCQLAVEFAYNVDSYFKSTFMYKYPNSKDSRIKFSVWDFDMTYGNFVGTNGMRAEKWLYLTSLYLWTDAMEHPEYIKKVSQRWKEYRTSNYSDEHIEYVIDSLTNLLTIGGAEKRNAEAWNTWKGKDWRGPRRICYEKYMAVSYEEEIDYLKEWIRKRLQWMDKELLEKE